VIGFRGWIDLADSVDIYIPDTPFNTETFTFSTDKQSERSSVNTEVMHSHAARTSNYGSIAATETVQ
jgi:hypothetical protein